MNSDVILLIALVLAIAAVAVAAVVAMRKFGWSSADERQVEKKVSVLDTILQLQVMGAGLLGGLKLVWDWRKAPPGSPRHLGWTVFLALAAAVAVWFLLRLVDHKINGPDIKPPAVAEDGLEE
jgi:predicted MFS family arabinose efflux permease